MDINPWQVESIQDFSFLKCPECTFDTKEEGTFQDHATENHPLSFVLFGKTCKENEEIFVDPVFIDIKQELPDNNESNHSESVEKSDAEDGENVSDNFLFKSSANHSEYAYEHVKPKKENTVHKKLKTFKCQIDSCLSRYVDKRGLKKHQEKVHSILPEEKKSFNCSTCDYVGNSKLELKLHIDNVHEGKKIKPLLCTICGWRGTWPAALKFHIQNVHEGKKSHVCNTCSKGFGTSFHLNEHISTVHEKIKSHQCPVCGKSFGVKQNLDNHIKGVHEKNKPHKCTLCEYAGTNRNQLQNHLKEVHEENKPFSCSLCNSKFGLKFRLNRHIKEVHEKQNRQTCSLCSSTFSHIGNLNAHIASVHEGKSSKKNNKKNKMLTE